MSQQTASGGGRARRLPSLQTHTPLAARGAPLQVPPVLVALHAVLAMSQPSGQMLKGTGPEQQAPWFKVPSGSLPV